MPGRIIEDSSLYETWKNVTAGTVILKKIDRNGNLIDEVIPGGRVLHVTPTERRLNQEQCATDALDFFMNGILTPVRLIESAEDVEALRENPNHMSEPDMMELFKTKGLKAFQERIDQVTNPITLGRMVEIAKAEEVNATVRQVQILEARLEDVSPRSTTTTNEVETISAPSSRK